MRQMKGENKKLKINNIRSDKVNITIDPTNTKKKIREY